MLACLNSLPRKRMHIAYLIILRYKTTQKIQHFGYKNPSSGIAQIKIFKGYKNI